MAKERLLHEITRAVLAREDVVRLLGDANTPGGVEVKKRVLGYIDELRTTQRHAFYRSLRYPLYPILFTIDRFVEHIERPLAAVESHRVIYASNHRSHTDYIVQPVVLDDHGIRPPLTAAGINLFGGPLGLLHRHITGAIPIRRNTKDPVYLITLKAYVAELLRRQDLLFYIEGGRSYNGELKSPKTGLLHAAMQAEQPHVVIIPIAIAYDLVLEDGVLAHQGVKRKQRAFGLELAELLALAVTYRSRAFIVFGEPIPLGDYRHDSRHDIVALSHRTRDAIGKLYKVLPTALVAAAMRPSILRQDLEAGVARLLDILTAAQANLGIHDAKQAVDEGVRAFCGRRVLRIEGDRIRVRDRHLIRYYSRSIQHLFSSAPDRT